MKISYSIAIILSCALAQLVSASTAVDSHNDSASFTSKVTTQNFVQKRAVDNRYLATALRRRQANNYWSQQSPAEGAPVAVQAAPQIDTILNGIRDSIRLALVSVSEDNGDDQGEEESHDSEDRKDRKQGKEVIKLVKKLVKAINELLKVSGHEENALDIEGVIKSAEKGILAPPASENGGEQLEARNLGALFKSPASLDRDLTAAPGTTTNNNIDSENDGGDDGSTEGDDQHKIHKAHSAPPASQANPVTTPATPATTGAPAAPGAPSPKVSDSDGGTDGDDEHHQRHPNPAKKRSSDPDPKEIKKAINEVDNALEELSGASQAREDGNDSGAAQLTAQVKQLEAAILAQSHA